jgi:hypothetical protein
MEQKELFVVVFAPENFNLEPVGLIMPTLIFY